MTVTAVLAAPPGRSPTPAASTPAAGPEAVRPAAVLALVERAGPAGADVSPDVRHLDEHLGRSCA